jgi:TRAP-type C4-dicarboxylate transport system substrate-binding protein
MKRTFAFSVSLIAIFFGLSIICKPGVTNAEQVSLKWATYVAPASAFGIPFQWTADQIEKESKGAVKIKIYWSQSLVGAKEMMEAVRDGVVDIGQSAPIYYPNKIPLDTLAFVPFLCTTGYSGKLHMLLDRVFSHPLWQPQLEKWNCKRFSTIATPPYNIMGKIPVRKLEDLKGIRLRAPSGLGEFLHDFFGAVPVSIVSPEIYSALDKGIVDCIAGCGDYYFDAYKIYEKSEYYTIGMDMAGGGSSNFINNQSWEKLTPNMKNIISTVLEKLPYVYEQAMASDEKIKNWRDKFMSYGVKIIEFPAAERKKLLDSAPAYWEKIIKKWEASGVEGIREAFNIVNNEIDKLNKEYPQDKLDVPEEIKNQVTAVEKAVRSAKNK